MRKLLLASAAIAFVVPSPAAFAGAGIGREEEGQVKKSISPNTEVPMDADASGGTVDRGTLERLLGIPRFQAAILTYPSAQNYYLNVPTKT